MYPKTDHIEPGTEIRQAAMKKAIGRQKITLARGRGRCRVSSFHATSRLRKIRSDRVSSIPPAHPLNASLDGSNSV
ncbi:hypothetical protein E4633_08500 [Geomonas terrae]|uniref:Uncharacterized protein n=1 Tax=Geomonas terrae TaxID=2562681 RepID=A0A4S1CFP1_9BACT|nr:hypothetical protein [Geomonas terrae]TGU72344.1 hypothetical protein E4633_08500 [Geomonas terrae]